MSNPANVKTLNTPVPVHGANLDTLVIDTRNVSISYDVPEGSPVGTISIVTANVALTNSASVVNGKIVAAQGQQPGSNAISKRYSASVSSGEPTAIYAAIFAEVTTVSGYTYSA